jgi:rare lipoprotein A (peptidoglycan hydrolase)
MSEKNDNIFVTPAFLGFVLVGIVGAFIGGMGWQKDRQLGELHARKVSMEKLASELSETKARLAAAQQENRVIERVSEQIQFLIETFTLKGKASYYAEPFHGRAAANGSTFDKYDFTAASRWLPLGSEWVVQSNATGKMVVVRITDRGPYKPGRIIDLSEAAFLAISPLKHGVIAVTMWPFIKEVGA